MQLLVYIMSIQSVVVEMFPEASLLASGFQGSVYALSENTVIKAISEGMFWETFYEGWQPVDKIAMQWVNGVNDLVVKFKDHLDVKDVEGLSIGHLVAMERVFPCVPTAFTVEELQSAIVVAEAQLEELWASGFAHCDLKRPDMVLKGGSNVDVLFNNILLTEVSGECIIRLIDLGFANLEQYDEDDVIDRHQDKDKADWEEFKLWLLNYPRD
jgi:serine/threonine protein kinase